MARKEEVIIISDRLDSGNSLAVIRKLNSLKRRDFINNSEKVIKAAYDLIESRITRLPATKHDGMRMIAYDQLESFKECVHKEVFTYLRTGETTAIIELEQGIQDCEGHIHHCQFTLQRTAIHH